MGGSNNNKNIGMIFSLVIIFILLATIVGGYFIFKNKENEKLNQALVTGYNVGYNQSLQDIAQGQAQTGNIFTWNNEAVKIISIRDVCTQMGLK
jgi:hypothetical protein